MSIKAYATVRLTGCNIRRFINLCTANHIKIWNLKYVSPKEYEACCSTEDIFLMKPHLKKTHTRLLVVKRQGYFAIRAFLYKIRIITAAITGVFCIHALICTRIWHIVPEGNRFTYDESVISFMESENVTIGSHKRADYSLLEKKLEETRLGTLLTGEYDANNAILTFHAGAGGTEAQDWTQMLYRMYNMWADRHGYTVKLMDYLDGDEAGIKSATIMIEGENAYGFLKSEHGIHRLVRISPFDSSGRRHTSFSAIEVMPEISDDNEIELRDEDIKMDVYRSSGAGGQKVNKTSSAVRLTHIPTGIVVSSQVERSHFQNLENCRNMLRARLAEIKEREHLEKISDIKGVQQKIEWGSQIRSYVFMPYTLAKDHRTGYENGNIQNVMDGDIDGFINAFLAMKAAT